MPRTPGRKNGGVSVLDFPLKQAMDEVFAGDAPYTRRSTPCISTMACIANPYELMTFYDNHDMPRMQADDAGFIDAHNWLFTARGIPVVYYGSEIGFRAGLAEHKGNRDYFGSDNIRAAQSHPVRAALARVANLRRNSVALQRGVQVNLAFTEDTAAFLRVYRHAGQSETALVLLNGSDEPRRSTSRTCRPGAPGRTRMVRKSSPRQQGAAELRSAAARRARASAWGRGRRRTHGRPASA